MHIAVIVYTYRTHVFTYAISKNNTAQHTIVAAMYIDIVHECIDTQIVLCSFLRFFL